MREGDARRCYSVLFRKRRIHKLGIKYGSFFFWSTTAGQFTYQFNPPLFCCRFTRVTFLHCHFPLGTAPYLLQKLSKPSLLTMRFNAVIWAYLVLQLVSAVYAAPRFDSRAPGEVESSSKRKGSEDDGSSPAKRIKTEEPRVMEEASVRVKQESHSPGIVENRPKVEISYIDKGRLDQLNLGVPLGEYDRGLIEKLVKKTVREKWRWSEEQVQSLLFDYPERPPRYWGSLVKRFFFKGPFQDCGANEEIGCLAEVVPTMRSGSVFKRSGNKKGDHVYDVKDLDIY
ncbi:hypothetical protein F5050DRAFT_1842440 [Lentinula boryana]|uniref:Uncharacterized protein n=1 Tax=Lentinula boryana TaxID=40481 RepID=A0ABQ8Q5T6_9AGAR|nr:hypothetical protein F5050DRAFT_1842440 [Lentinula boryana]